MTCYLKSDKSIELLVSADASFSQFLLTLSIFLSKIVLTTQPNQWLSISLQTKLLRV